MKIDPGIHIVMHLVFFGKTGVTQRLISHHECLAPMLYLVEGHKFLFVTKTFHVPNMNLKIKCKLLG
jgi:hypothetical protein